MHEPTDPMYNGPDPAGCAIINAIVKGGLLIGFVPTENGLMPVWSASAAGQLGQLARNIGKIRHTDPVLAEYDALPETTPRQGAGGMSPQQMRDAEEAFDSAPRRRHGRGQ